MRAVKRYLPWLLFSAAAWAAEPPPQSEPPAQVAAVAAPQPSPVSVPVKAGDLPPNQAVLELLREVESLKAEVARLRGQAELQSHQIESLGKRQGDLYGDLDRRMEELSRQLKSVAQPAASVPAVPAVAAAAAAQPAPAAAAEDPLAESNSYEAALNHFKTGNYAKSVEGFAAFLKAYPNSSLAPNALYWSGYAYYAAKDYKNALAQQMKLVSAYPQSGKVPDALLNIASNQIELNDLASAKKNLEELVAKYPGTNAAAIATRRLNLLK